MKKTSYICDLCESSREKDRALLREVKIDIDTGAFSKYKMSWTYDICDSCLREMWLNSQTTKEHITFKEWIRNLFKSIIQL